MLYVSDHAYDLSNLSFEIYSDVFAERVFLRPITAGKSFIDDRDFRGRVTVSVAKQDDSFLRISVQDTGACIPPDSVGRVFEKFYQVKETIGMARGSGTGLGLTIAKQTVEQHGGRIWVESVFGKGTTFHFTVPPAAGAA